MTKEDYDFLIRLAAAMLACKNPFGPDDDGYRAADLQSSVVHYEGTIKRLISELTQDEHTPRGLVR